MFCEPLSYFGLPVKLGFPYGTAGVKREVPVWENFPFYTPGVGYNFRYTTIRLILQVGIYLRLQSRKESQLSICGRQTRRFERCHL